MPPLSEPPGLFAKLQGQVAAARFLTFSALIHTVLLIFGGSVVIVHHYTAEPEDFEAPSEIGLADAPSHEPPVTTDLPSMFADPSSAQPAVTSVPLNHVITSVSTSTAFRAAVPTGANLSSNTLKNALKPSSKGIEGKLKSSASGMMGGTSRNPFGMRKQEIGALKGTFYDLKQTRSGRSTDVTPQEYGETAIRFVQEGWRESILSGYFRSNRPLYTTQIMIPNMPADEGPKAFDLQRKVKPSRWLIHYQGRVSPPRSGTYHFVGGGDDILMVRFDRKLVLERNWNAHSDWKSLKDYDYGFSGIPKGFAKGDAIQVRAGEWYDMEVLIGEQPGGLVFFCLLIEEEGGNYEKDAKGNPILPVFRVAEGPMPKLEEGQTLPPYSAEGQVWKAAPSEEKKSAFSGLDRMER